MKTFKQFLGLFVGKLPKGGVNLLEFMVAFDFALSPVLVYAAFIAKEKDPRRTWMKRTLTYIGVLEILLFAYGGFFWCAAASVVIAFADMIRRERDPKNVTAAAETAAAGKS
jgi:hypothetical protein